MAGVLDGQGRPEGLIARRRTGIDFADPVSAGVMPIRADGEMSPHVRGAGVLVEQGRLLLCAQTVTESAARNWSLPGGRLEFRESIEACLIREMKEETGLSVKVGDLLYVADRIQDGHHIVDVTFLVHRLTGEVTTGHEPEAGANPIHAVTFVPLDTLTEHGFSTRYQQLAQNGFPSAGSYQGPIANLGL